MSLMEKKISPANKLEGQVRPPGDKSISHRALILGSLCSGETTIIGLLMGEDVKHTIGCLKALGVTIKQAGSEVTVVGAGVGGLKKAEKKLDAGNSGTLMRILTGVLAGQDFECRFIGDESLHKRPMARIIRPLKKMGAEITARKGKYPPLNIRGRTLKAISYKLPVASAQVKSCILLAGLLAEGNTQVIEPNPSRDHTERMLEYLGANIIREANTITLSGGDLKGDTISVPADFSSASFFLTAGAIVPGATVKVLEVGVNPTRTGFLTVLKKMGANIKISNQRILNNEPRADITVQSSNLEGIAIDGELIPLLIDEIPLIAVLATQADGRTVIKGAEEARVKETDRVKATVENLKRMGAEVKERPDGMVIKGKQALKGGIVKSYGDHRMTMAFSVAGLIAQKDTIIQNAQWVNVSYPHFYKHLKELMQ